MATYWGNREMAAVKTEPMDMDIDGVLGVDPEIKMEVLQDLQSGYRYYSDSCIDCVKVEPSTISQPYVCGSCNSSFVTVWKLHAHIQDHGLGGSYHYDHKLRTAYPKYDSVCSETQTFQNVVVLNPHSMKASQSSGSNVLLKRICVTPMGSPETMEMHSISKTVDPVDFNGNAASLDMTVASHFDGSRSMTSHNETIVDEDGWSFVESKPALTGEHACINSGHESVSLCQHKDTVQSSKSEKTEAKDMLRQYLNAKNSEKNNHNDFEGVNTSIESTTDLQMKHPCTNSGHEIVCQHKDTAQSFKSENTVAKDMPKLHSEPCGIVSGPAQKYSNAKNPEKNNHEDQAESDVDRLPDAVPRGIFLPVRVFGGEPSIITFDLKTTDLIRGGVMPHITHIAATNVLSGETFNVYVKPGYPITPETQRLTGISIRGTLVNGQPVKKLTIKTALEQFSDWLEKYPNVCLVAHNGRKFDYPILLNTLLETDMKGRFIAGVTAFVDSISVFREVYPNTCLKQESLVNSKLGVTYDVHNAMAGAESLRKLLQYCNICNKDILAHSFAPVAVLNTLLFNRQKNLNIRSLDTLVSNGVCKRHTAENIAGSGLNMHHLLTIYKRGGEDGLRYAFVNRNCDGQPRVTNNKRILDIVVPKLVDFISVQK